MYAYTSNNVYHYPSDNAYITRTTTRVDDNPYEITLLNPSESMQDEIKELKEKLQELSQVKKISLVHNCVNCGARLDVEENKPVFHCKYCGSTYIIGPQQILSAY